MDKIVYPLEPGSGGEAVSHLHAALWVVLERGAVLRDDERTRAELMEALEPDRQEGYYGEPTQKVVQVFQGERGLEEHGQVDRATADALNAQLRKWGLLDDDEDDDDGSRDLAAYVVGGSVRREDGLVLAGSRVRTVHLGPQGPIRLGEDVTDAEGRYTIRYEALSRDAVMTVRVSVLDGEGNPLQSGPILERPRPVEVVDLVVPLAAGPRGQRRIAGRVLLEDGRPAEQLQLRLYQHGFGGAASHVAETTTLTGGSYAFSFDGALPRGSFELRAVSADGHELTLSEPLTDFDGARTVTVDLAAPAALAPLGPEYQRLAADLTPLVGGNLAKLAQADESTERPDLTVLNRSTGWDARLISLAATSQRIGADDDVDLSPDLIYGLLRAGLPSDKLLLAQVGVDVAVQALGRAGDAGIVHVDDAQRARFPTEFKAFARKVQLAVPAPGSRATYGELLESSGLDAPDQATFADVYLNHKGTGPELWAKVAEAGFDGEQIGTLQLHGKLAFLTANSDALTARMRQSVDTGSPAQLVEKGLYEAGSWVDEIDATAGITPDRSTDLSDADQAKLDALIPAVYVGDSVDARRDRWAEDMARKVRLSYPTHVVADQVARGALPVEGDPDAAATLLRNAAAQGFRLGETPVDAFLDSHAGVTAGIVPTGMVDLDVREARRDLKTLQRVYQITPTNDAMATLLQLGLTSAYDVAALTEEVFVERFSHKFGSAAMARLVYRKATQVTSITYNLFTIGKMLDGTAPIQAVSGTPAQHAAAKASLKGSLKLYPTMESLFGSMDACECEHCSSVLGPAAYLVDLLQFVDAEPAVWANFLGHWKERHGGAAYPHPSPYDVLTARRPDLAHIPLTCANAKTALPYIDLVNEILEYTVAHDGLAAEAAHDTGDATTADLLAEPQNVIATAYEQLDGARYPLALPFDLPLETTRQFCDYFQRPLARVLEAFRAGDELFSTAQDYDYERIFVESLGISPAEWELLTDPAPLTDDRWFDLYGYWRDRPPIAGATNTTNATVTIPDAAAARVSAGDPCTYLVTADGTLHGETRVVSAVGAPGSGGAGGTTITFEGVWTAPPVAGDLLVFDAAGALRSAKALARRLGVTYRELVDVVRSGFANPKLAELALLQKLNVGIHSVVLWRDLPTRTLYAQNKDLLDKQRRDLTPADQQRFDALTTSQWDALKEFQSFERRLVDHAAKHGIATADLEAALQAIALDEILVLADPDAGCDFDLTTLRYASGRAADAIAFVRINLLVRLWRRLRWPLAELDRALQVLTPKNTPYDAAHVAKRPLRTTLIHLAHLHDLHGRAGSSKVSRASLLTLWSDLLAAGHYAALFLTPGVLRNDPVFDDPLGDYLTGPELVADHLPAVQGALNLSADEIGEILTDTSQSLATAALSLPNVSLLHRYRVLATAVGRPVGEVIALKQLSGLDPFVPLAADPLTELDDDHPFVDTLRFVDMCERLDDSGFDLTALDYLFRHRVDDAGRYRPDPAATQDLLRTLADGIRTIRAEHAVPADPGALSDDVLRRELGLALPADVVDRFLAMLNGTVETTATAGGVVAADQLSPAGLAGETAIRDVRYDAARQTQTLTYRGVLFPDEKAALLARLPRPVPPGPHVPSAVLGTLLGDVEAAARSFFDTHLRTRPPGSRPGGGFLDWSDFELLFRPTPASATEAELQARVRDQRSRLAVAFLPYLQDRLVGRVVIDTLIAATAADPAQVESLLSDARLLSRAGTPTTPLLDAFVGTAATGIGASFYASTDATGPALASPVVADVDTALEDGGQPVTPAGTHSVRYKGYLQVPAPEAYRFGVLLGRQGAGAELRFAHLPAATLSGTAQVDGDELGDGADEYVELEPNTLYRFTLTVTDLGAGDARLVVQGETLPRGVVTRLSLRPAAAVDEAEQALVLLTKALQLLTGLGLGEREARYLLTHLSDFDGVPLRSLPVQEATPDTALFGFFLRLVGFAQLTRDLGAQGTDLLGVFEASAAQLYPRLAALTRHDEATVQDTAEALSAAPAFASERPLRRLWDALDVVTRFGVPVAAIQGWGRIVDPGTSAEDQQGIAAGLREAIKGRFDAASWRAVAQPIYGRLRRRQRDALVAYLLHRRGFATMEQLYEYFLIDPGMEPVVQTSRIRAAIGSVQLFVQRCLLNLEPLVHPSAIINAKQWEWMKRYRVWEANRKIFLFPENWLEPEFRDDKTAQFAELESALLTGDVSADLVEDAFLGYLSKLEELARLDIVAMHLETRDDPANNVLHVIGRTYGSPHKHFYRRYAHEVWTPWEPVTTEVTGDHLAPAVWRDRLYLFWVTFAERGETAKPSSTTPVATLTVGGAITAFTPATKKVDVQLHWSEYLNGEWSTHESSSFAAPLTCDVSPDFDPAKVFVHVERELSGDGLIVQLSKALNGGFRLANRNSSPQPDHTSRTAPANPYTVNEAHAAGYRGSGALKVTLAPRITTEDGKAPMRPAETPGILRQGGAFSLLPCDNDITLSAHGLAPGSPAVEAAIQAGLAEVAALMKPVFYQDERHTFFVQPDVTERTVELWEEWITHPAQPEQEWDRPEWWWDQLVVMAQIPRKESLPPFPGGPPPGDPTVDPRALYTLTPADDWLVNQGTTVLFADRLIGPQGDTGMEIVLTTAVPGGAEVIAVQPGGALPADTFAVVAGHVGNGQVRQLGGGMNIVGPGGFNSALALNYAGHGVGSAGPLED